MSLAESPVRTYPPEIIQKFQDYWDGMNSDSWADSGAAELNFRELAEQMGRTTDEVIYDLGLKERAP